MNKEDKLKLFYEHQKTYCFAMYTVVLAFIIGILLNFTELSKNENLLIPIGLLTTLFVIVLLVHFCKLWKIYYKLLDGTEEKDLLK
jgi:hypothetical protein